jgi:hypothetical protein
VAPGDLAEALRALVEMEPGADNTTIARSGLTDEQQKLFHRLVPFSKSLPGTALGIKHERTKLMAMMGSTEMQRGIDDRPVDCRWFTTFAPADAQHGRLFAMASAPSNLNREQLRKYLNMTAAMEDEGAGSSSTSERPATEDESVLLERMRWRYVMDHMPPAKRTELYRDHPALVARQWHSRQSALWEAVMRGEDRPLGEIAYAWRRIEFQMRGAPHSHCIVWVYRHRHQNKERQLNNDDGPAPGDIAARDDADAQQRVKSAVESAVTCCLTPRPSGSNVDLKPGDGTYELFY